MIRHLSTIASAISLLLCMTAAVTWVSTGRGHRRLWSSVHARGPYVEVLIKRNELRFDSYRTVHSFVPPSRNRLIPTWLNHLGMDAWDGAGGDAMLTARIENGPVTYSYQQVRSFSFHLGLIIGATGLFPALWVLRRRTQAKGLCCHCGYDLRASGERCPECGTPIPTEVETKT